MKALIFLISIVLLSLESSPPAFAARRWIGGSAGTGISFLSGGDFHRDLSLIDGHLKPDYAVRGSLHVRYELSPAIGLRIHVPGVSRFGASYTFSEEFDGETRAYDGSLRFWTVGPGVDFVFFAGDTRFRPMFAAGFAGMFPYGPFLQEERSDEIETVRRVNADRFVALHAISEFGVQYRANPLSAAASIKYEVPVTRYFSEHGWPDLRGHGLTVNITIEREI
ncbi:MAG: hypothetical protein ACOC0B_00965 [bacterium]